MGPKPFHTIAVASVANGRIVRKHPFRQRKYVWNGRIARWEDLVLCCGGVGMGRAGFWRTAASDSRRRRGHRRQLYAESGDIRSRAPNSRLVRIPLNGGRPEPNKKSLGDSNWGSVSIPAVFVMGD